jgi:UDP-N-acetyl-D-glucosamine dehydrogenase
MLEAKIKSYLQANDRDTAAKFALELTKAKQELGENEGQLKMHEDAYNNNVTKIKHAMNKLGDVKQKIAKYDAELKMSRAEAEMAKLIENTFRQVNIALVNELAILARELDVDIWEALQAASTKPFGYMPFWPGPGVGGHCISIDPSYLSWRAGQQLGYRIGFIEHANEVNNRMPGYVVARLGEALNDLHKPIRGTKILAIGVTYKAGVNDQRESPALAVIERLADKGAEVSYHDPFAPELELDGRMLASKDLTPETVAAHDCVVVLTAHADVDYRMLAKEALLLFDTRGVTTGMDLPNIVRL